MYKIQKLNEIAPAISAFLPPQSYEVAKGMDNPDAILVRSANMHDLVLPHSVLAIARAGAGTNNIPIPACSEQGIAVFNTPGANANSVKELVLGSMIVLSRNIVGAVEWTSTLKGKGDAVPKLVEEGKKQFIGPEIRGKTLGVIGLGAIGTMVANDAAALGMEVIGYDPFISVDAAWRLSRSVRRCLSLDQLYAECDYITLHTPLLDQTREMLNKDAFGKMKQGVRIMNFARSELVCTADMIEAIGQEIVGGYATDFPTEELLGVPGILAIPHLGASSPEAEDNCAVMAARQLALYLEEGTLKNCVNYPDCELPYSGLYRLTAIHQNITNMVGQITAKLASEGLNIANMINKSKGAYAYTVIDLNDKPTADNLAEIAAIEGVIRVRGIEPKVND